MLDPTVGEGVVTAMRKEVHRMELRHAELLRVQERLMQVSYNTAPDYFRGGLVARRRVCSQQIGIAYQKKSRRPETVQRQQVVIDKKGPHRQLRLY
jgi:hypothetical protein